MGRPGGWPIWQLLDKLRRLTARRPSVECFKRIQKCRDEGYLKSPYRELLLWVLDRYLLYGYLDPKGDLGFAVWFDEGLTHLESPFKCARMANWGSRPSFPKEAQY